MERCVHKADDEGRKRGGDDAVGSVLLEFLVHRDPLGLHYWEGYLQS